MKNLALLFLFLATSIQLANAQEVNNKNWTLIHEKTATWCPYCGTWGWDLKTQMINKFANNEVIFMAVHHSGDLNNPTATAFGDNFGGSAQPVFFVDGVNINAHSGNIATSIENTSLEVDFKKEASTFAGVGITATLDEATKTISAKAKVEFFSEVTSGDYYFGLYLLEDVQNTQASRTGVQLHKNVLRKSLLPQVFNNPLKSGAIAPGTTFDINGSIDQVTSAKENYKVVGIIWTKVNNKFLFFNANIVEVKGVSSSDDTAANASEFNVYQSESGNIVIHFDDNYNASKSQITITDLSGKTVLTEQRLPHTGNKMNVSGNFTPGMYIVTVMDEKQNKVSKKILLQ